MSRTGESTVLFVTVSGAAAFLFFSALLPPLFSGFLIAYFVTLYREYLGIKRTLAPIGGAIYVLSGAFVVITGMRPLTWIPDTEFVVLGFGVLCLGYLWITDRLKRMSGVVESKLPLSLDQSGRGPIFSTVGGAALFFFFVWRIKTTFMPSAILSIAFPFSFIVNLLSRQSGTVLGDVVAFISLISGLAGLLACAFLVDSYDMVRNYYRSRNGERRTPTGGTTNNRNNSPSTGGIPLQELQSLPQEEFLSIGISVCNERGYEVVDVLEDEDGYTEAVITDGTGTDLFIVHRRYLYDDFEISRYVTNIVQSTSYQGHIDHVLFMTDCIIPRERKQQFAEDHYFGVVDGTDLCQWISDHRSSSQ